MPVYEYQCRCGRVSEGYFPSWRGVTDEMVCEECGGMMKRIMSVPAHPITDENASWIGSHMGVIGDAQDNARRPITGRREFNKYLEANNLRPKKSWFDNVSEV